ncbi:MAG: hypothetical protein LN563_01125, partial [Rickettsia endosymbiont of Platyusa sonomae]|nr:hypothetical protein [Rickettsia endosymbiont of Platyusa sonomae]
ACPIVPKEPLNPPSPSTPQPKPLSPAELSGAKFLLATLTADKQAAQAKQQQYYQNILQIAGQNMCDAEAKKLARDETLMQQAYAAGGSMGLDIPKIVKPGRQAKTMKDVGRNLYDDFIDIRSNNFANVSLFPLAAGGELADYVGQNIVHTVHSIEGGAKTLAVIAKPVNMLVDGVKEFVKARWQDRLSEKNYQRLSEWYNRLPNGAKLTVSMFEDGFIIAGAGNILKIATSGITQLPGTFAKLGSPKPLLAIEGTTSGIGEISAISEVDKIFVDTGAALGENALTKLEKPTTSSAVPKVEQKLPTFEVAIESSGKVIEGVGKPPVKYEGESILFQSRDAARQFGDTSQVQKSANKFFGSATNEIHEATNTLKYGDFEIIKMENGNIVMKHTAKSKTPGYNKSFIKIIDNDGTTLRHFKETIDPRGIVIEIKIIK